MGSDLDPQPFDLGPGIRHRGAGLASLKAFGEQVDLSRALFFGTRDFVVRGAHPRMGRMRTGLFAFLFRNGRRITDRFNLPPERTFEIGREIKI